MVHHSYRYPSTFSPPNLCVTTNRQPHPAPYEPPVACPTPFTTQFNSIFKCHLAITDLFTMFLRGRIIYSTSIFVACTIHPHCAVALNHAAHSCFHPFTRGDYISTPLPHAPSDTTQLMTSLTHYRTGSISSTSSTPPSNPHTPSTSNRHSHTIPTSTIVSTL